MFLVDFSPKEYGSVSLEDFVSEQERMLKQMFSMLVPSLQGDLLEKIWYRLVMEDFWSSTNMKP